MRPLIDADILVYESASAAEIGWMSEGTAPFEYVEGLLEGYVLAICAAVEATEEPIFFLSSDNNFRYNIATVKPYKGNRKHETRPFHYENVRAYIAARWNTIICNGYEADDGLAIYQTNALRSDDRTIICSRDKDLRQIPGWHYTWARGGQEESGPDFVSSFGELDLSVRDVIPSNPDKRPYKKYKCRGSGLKWFYAQCLMGDPVDNIPGLKGTSDLKAYELLKDAQTEEECHKIVLDSYNNIYKEDGAKMMLEQARLVWMVRELDDNGQPVMWNLKGE